MCCLLQCTFHSDYLFDIFYRRFCWVCQHPVCFNAHFIVIIYLLYSILDFAECVSNFSPTQSIVSCIWTDLSGRVFSLIFSLSPLLLSPSSVLPKFLFPSVCISFSICTSLSIFHIFLIISHPIIFFFLFRLDFHLQLLPFPPLLYYFFFHIWKRSAPNEQLYST